MPISRRIFLRAGTMFAIGAAANSRFGNLALGQKPRQDVPAVTGFRVPVESMADPLTFFTKSTFSAHLNSQFRLRMVDARSVVVTLIAVNDLAPSAGNVKGQVVGGRECFSLIFSGQQLPQDTYTVEHGALGTFKLLLVPSGKQDGVPQLEAVVNRLFS